MPVLNNPKHERFAQEVAKGKTADEAYRLAGYRPQRSNASRMIANDSIRTRVSEIQSRAAEKAEITVAAITEGLLRIAEKAEHLSDAPGLSVSRAALMDAAKLNGLIVDKSQSTITLKDISDDPMTDNDWSDKYSDEQLSTH